MTAFGSEVQISVQVRINCILEKGEGQFIKQLGQRERWKLISVNADILDEYIYIATVPSWSWLLKLKTLETAETGTVGLVWHDMDRQELT